MLQYHSIDFLVINIFLLGNLRDAKEMPFINLHKPYRLEIESYAKFRKKKAPLAKERTKMTYRSAQISG